MQLQSLAELFLPSGGCVLFLGPPTDPSPRGHCAFGVRAAKPQFHCIGGAALRAVTFGRSGEFIRRKFTLVKQTPLWACQARFRPLVTLEPQIRNHPLYSTCSMQYWGHAYV